MSDQELFLWGLIAFILLVSGVTLTVIEFNQLGKSPKNDAEGNQ